MGIVKTINNDYEFWEWLRKSDNYKNNFSQEGAKAVQEYYEQLSDDMGENIEFDPIAWCCEWSEYDSFEDFRLNGGYDEDSKYKTLEDLQDATTVIVTENGKLLVREF